MIATGRSKIPPDALTGVAGAEYVQCDASSEALGGVLLRHGIEAIVLLAFLSRPTPSEREAFDTCVAATSRALALAAACGTRRVVLMSSVGVYGPRAPGPALVEGDAPRPNGFQFSRLKALQELAAHDAAIVSGLDLLIVRPCTVVGGRGGNFLLSLLSGPLVPVPAFCEPEWQFLHITDFCAGVVRLLVTGASGLYNLVPEDTVSLREAVRILGGRPVAVPEVLLAASARATWRLFPNRAVPRTALSFLGQPPIASGARLARDTGFVPEFSSRQALKPWTIPGVARATAHLHGYDEPAI